MLSIYENRKSIFPERKVFIWLLSLHFIVLLLHTGAHFYHQVMPDFKGTLLIIFGYYLLPGLGLFQQMRKSRYGLLAVLIGISVAFTHGFLYHFIFDTADYVCYFGVHISGLWFSVTAYGLAIIDFSIMAIVLRGLFNTTRSSVLR